MVETEKVDEVQTQAQTAENTGQAQSGAGGKSVQPSKVNIQRNTQNLLPEAASLSEAELPQTRPQAPSLPEPSDFEYVSLADFVQQVEAFNRQNEPGREQMGSNEASVKSAIVQRFENNDSAIVGSGEQKVSERAETGSRAEPSSNTPGVADSAAKKSGSSSRLASVSNESEGVIEEQSDSSPVNLPTLSDNPIEPEAETSFALQNRSSSVLLSPPDSSGETESHRAGPRFSASPGPIQRTTGPFTRPALPQDDPATEHADRLPGALELPPKTPVVEAETLSETAPVTKPSAVVANTGPPGPAVQRAISAGQTPVSLPDTPPATDTGASETDSTNAEEKPAPDPEQISRQVYQIIRRRLRVEYERLYGRRG